MAVTRRTVVVGVGTLMAGAAAIAGTGAFSGNANRAVSIGFADDSDAYLEMGPIEGDDRENITIKESDGTIGVSVDSLSANARTALRPLIAFTNTNERAIEEMTVDIDDESLNADLSVTAIPDQIASEETVTGLGLVIDTRDYAAAPELSATISISTVLALEEES